MPVMHTYTHSSGRAMLCLLEVDLGLNQRGHFALPSCVLSEFILCSLFLLNVK